jgi:hypothetical protein
MMGVWQTPECCLRNRMTLNRPVAFLSLLLLSLLLAACTSPAQSEPLPNSPVPAPVGLLNLIAVGIALGGGILGLILAARRRPGGEPDPAAPKPKKRKKPHDR